MGNTVQGEIRCWLVGDKGTGKSHFIDHYKHGGDATQRPTNGFYRESYMHRGWRFNFEEWGNTPRIYRSTFKNSNHHRDNPPHFLLVFVNDSDTYEARTATLSLALGFRRTLATKPFHLVWVINHNEGRANGQRQAYTMMEQISHLSEESCAQRATALPRGIEHVHHFGGGGGDLLDWCVATHIATMRAK